MGLVVGGLLKVVGNRRLARSAIDGPWDLPADCITSQPGDKSVNEAHKHRMFDVGMFQ